MARKIILDTQYTFNPTTGVVVLTNRYIPQERMLLITNVTKNKVIFNFSDPSLTATSYVTSMTGATGVTTITLAYNTTTMSSTDKLQITVDEYSEKIQPSEELTDPVGKLRVSTPQSLIDTDFEYGTQVSKWENLSMINNRPLGYQTVPNIQNLQSMYVATSTRNVVVSFNGTHYIGAGTPIVIQDTYIPIANGNYVVDATSTNTGTTASPVCAAVTGSITAISNTGSAVTYATSSTAGLVVGQQVTITGASSSGYNVTNQFITAIVSNTSFTIASTATGSTSTASFTAAPWISYTARAANSSSITSILDANKTALYQAAFYSGVAIGGTAQNTTISGLSGSNTINVGSASGIIVGMTVTGANISAGTTVTAVNSATQVVTLSSSTTGAVTGSGQFGGITNLTYTGNSITITTAQNHGLALGNEIAITGLSTTGTNVPNGSFVVATINTPSTFTIYTPNTPTGTITFNTGTVYVRPQGQFLHRPFDGGVIFSTNGSSNFEQAIRQTRRYFRYQSGKGIQMSTGTILKPNIQVDSLTSSGTTVTVQTKDQHNLQVGATITLNGANEVGYNGTFTVTGVTGYNTFTYTALSAPSASPASGAYELAISGWYGAKNRMGIFDFQNGMFWEFDGQTLSVVRRTSTFQIAGKVSATNGSNVITQTNSSYPTTFSKQLTPGDYIVLRGASYRVTDIISDTTLWISPAYRGTTDNYIIPSRTVETRVPQSSFNIDKLDGTGPSGYNIDLSKMQMWYIDYSWYGAGAIRYGVRGTDGNIIYAHKIANNNLNYEAYMRSGNMAGRYETSTIPMATTLTANVAASDTTINVASTAGFPSSGTLVIRNSSVYEYVNYTGITSTSFTGLTRGQAGNSSLALTIAVGSNTASVSTTAGLQVGQKVIAPLSFPDGTFIAAISGTSLTLSQGALTANPVVMVPPMGASSGQSFTYAAGTPISVEFGFPTFAPTISHWGTAAIMDGGFTPDKSLLFTYGQQTPISIPTSSVVFTSAASGSAASSTITLSGTGTNTTANILPGMTVSGTGIAAGTYVTAVTGTTTFTITPNPTTTITSGTITLTGNTTRALMSIRLAPAVDNGVGAGFGQRDLINRAQLILSTLDVSLLNTNIGNILVRGYINAQPFAGSQQVYGNAIGVPLYVSTASGTGSVVTVTTTTPHGLNVNDQAVISGITSSTGYNGTYTIQSVPSATTFTVNSTYSTSYSSTGSPTVMGYKQWTNAVGNIYGSLTSSLAQIADYAPNSVTGGTAGAYSVTGGEVTGGFFANQTTELDLSLLRDLGNAIMGGGGVGTPAYAGQNGYPDGPDVLTIVVTNLGTNPVQVIGRVAWTEAQA